MRLKRSEFIKHGTYKGPRLQWVYKKSWPIEECIPENRIGIQLVTEKHLYSIVPENDEEEKIIRDCIFEEV